MSSTQEPILFDNADETDIVIYKDDEYAIGDDGMAKWLPEPRGNFRPSALSLGIHNWWRAGMSGEDEVTCCFPYLDKLQLSVGHAAISNIFERYSRLTKLELLVSSDPHFERLQFPESL